jgi:hypothetical protein
LLRPHGRLYGFDMASDAILRERRFLRGAIQARNDGSVSCERLQHTSWAFSRCPTVSHVLEANMHVEAMINGMAMYAGVALAYVRDGPHALGRMAGVRDDVL